jgi:hypothetical protein
MGKVAERKIRRYLDALALAFDGRAPIVHTYPDGSISGETRLRVPEGVSIKDRMSDVNDFLIDNKMGAWLPKLSWVAIGLKWEPRTPTSRTIHGIRTIKVDSPEFDKISGLRSLYTSYYKSLPKASATAVPISRTLNRRRYVPGGQYEEVTIRVHWNERGKRPKRPHKAVKPPPRRARKGGVKW